MIYLTNHHADSGISVHSYLSKSTNGYFISSHYFTVSRVSK